MNACLEIRGVALEEDQDRLRGGKGRPDPDRQATLYGHDDGLLVLGRPVGGVAQAPDSVDCGAGHPSANLPAVHRRAQQIVAAHPDRAGRWVPGA